MNEAKATLRNYHALVERTYKGDTDAIVALVDLQAALLMAQLTDRQAEALALVYGEDLTQKVAGERMGVGQNTISELITMAEASIDEVYEYNAWLDGELTKEDLDDETNDTVGA